jgi:hypothetical protein
VGIAGERGEDVTRHIDVVRRLAEVELRLAQEPAPFSDDLENPSRFDPLGGGLICASRLIDGALLGRGGAVLPGRAVPATRTLSLALTAAAAATAAPSPSSAARSATAILRIARRPRARLPVTAVVVGTLSIGRLGRRGGACVPRVRSATLVLRSSRSGTGGPAVLPSMIVGQG